MTHLSNHTDHSTEAKNFFTKCQLKQNGYMAIVKGSDILILSAISDSDLEELEWVFEGYTITRSKHTR